MVTRAWFAWRYKNRYYRQFVGSDGYPSGLGRELTRMIPRQAERREAWIQHIIRGLEAGVAYRRETNIPDMDENEYDYIPEIGDQFGKEVALFSDIASTNIWINCEYDCVDWTYVIDFDYRAFSVNGEIHFNLDNMPPHNPGIPAYFEEETPVVPPEYLTTVSYWPNPGYDVDLVLKEYDESGATVTTADVWSAPCWGSLSTSQHLSADLVKAIVSDYQKILSTPDFFTNYNRIIMICWQIVCAAAPSHVLCPDRITPAAEGLLYSKTAIEQFDSGGRLIPWRIVKGPKNCTRPSSWFRGCFIKFFYRLDDETYLKREVTKIATKIKANGCVNGNIGIIMSSWQIVAVAVDGSDIRHTPALDFYDGKGGVRDGLLLLIHLLSPALTVSKTPWTKPHSLSCSPSSVLPQEVLQHILRYADDDSYHFTLPLVSRLVRSMCLARPRVGGFILTGHNSNGTYRALSTRDSTEDVKVRLVRNGNKAKEGLVCSFQHHQVGTGRDAEAFLKRIAAGQRNRGARNIGWDQLTRGTLVPTMRVQIAEGTWCLVSVDEA
ncbi:hypothetical protein RhiJN_16415 [Ceratobasidium sp. AG-Ba]|nr:hypothetical protein RhiJN_16415 [Ceratobasidium sp. AG-Ba]